MPATHDHTPLVSILMTSHNREKYIVAAIESVLALHHANFELIIVDDGSTDRTVEIARQYVAQDSRVQLHINEQNLGDYPNRNNAASYASGKYLKYLDSDDIIYPYSLNIMVDAMEAFPGAALGLSSHSIQDDAAAFPLVYQPKAAYYQHFFKGGLLFSGPSGCIIRSDAFRDLGGFSGKRYVSDTELWLLLAQDRPVLLLPPALIWWRRHDMQEFNLGHINEEYVMLNYEMNKRFLETSCCPLEESDRLNAIRNYKNRFGRKVWIKLIRGRFNRAKRMKEHSGITVSEIVRSLFPVNKINKLVGR